MNICASAVIDLWAALYATRKLPVFQDLDYFAECETIAC